MARETADADSTILDLVPFHQVRAQAFFRMRLHLVQYLAGILVMKVVRPPAKGGVHASNNIFQWYRCTFTTGHLRYTLLDFCKRFGSRTYMRVAFARPPTLAHPYFKTQEDKAFLPCINDMGLALVKREIKPIQHMSYRCQWRICFASAQHHEVIRIADDVCLQFSAQLMLVPDPVKQVQVAVCPKAKGVKAL